LHPLAPGFVYREEQTGTNAMGTAPKQRRPTVVRGGEHSADVLTTMAGTGAPVTDLRTGEVVGVVDLTCSVEDTSPLMLPLARRTAREIEQRLLGGCSMRERVLHDLSSF
jgi:transcriptional regulator of acetoin/glycerol metabolism